MDLGALTAGLKKRRRKVDAQVASKSGGGPLFFFGKQHRPEKFLPKSSTGFVGLKNQGATCYLNSLFQSLYMNPDFRAAVFQWNYDPPTGDAKQVESKEKFNKALQLQKLFARLSLSDEIAATTSNVTDSCGWIESDVGVQQDVQEMYHVLFDQLKADTVGTSIGDCISNLHCATSRVSFTTCMTCGDTNERPEGFLDLMLPIEGVSTIEQALAKYVTPEELDGINCSPCGTKVKKMKGYRFSSLPQVLSLQLQRFGMNWGTMQRTKLSTKVLFPDVLDVRPYLTADSKDGPVDYELFSILMHIGGAASGHYFAYIKDLASNKWIIFNDSTVKECTPAEVDIIFGRESPSESKQAKQAPVLKKVGPGFLGPGAGGAFANPTTEAYMLLYRQKASDSVPSAAALQTTPIPQRLVDSLSAENANFALESAEYKRLKTLLHLQVHHGPENKLETRVEVDQKDTLLQAEDKVFRALHEAETQEGDVKVLRDQVRFRRWNGKNNTLEDTFTAEQYAAQLTDPLVKFSDFAHVGWETRPQGAEFEVYVPPQMQIFVKLLDVKTGELGEQKEVSVNQKHSTVAQLREAVAAVLAVEPASVGLAVADAYDINFLRVDSDLLSAVNVRANNTVSFTLFRDPLFESANMHKQR